VRRCSAILVLLPLAAGCDLLWPPSTEDTGPITWTGRVLDGPYDGENGVFTGGSFEVTDLEGHLLARGEEPWADDPGAWRIDVRGDWPVAIHLAAEGVLGAVWRSTTPATDGYWYTGALFAYDEATWMPFFEQFDDVGLLDPDECWFWGAPEDPEAWAGAAFTLTDGALESAEIMAFEADDEGFLVPAGDGPVVYLLAFGLAPGDVRLEVSTGDGRTMSETWPARGAEVISAWFLALPREN
jgi:hypothetical protein